MESSFLSRLGTDRTLAVVRARSIPSGAELCAALLEGGIRNIEFTFTTPEVLKHVTEAVGAGVSSEALIGVGTVLSAGQAESAIDAGAQFLVTPGIRAEVAQVAQQAGIPFALGALTPSEVAQAADLGASVVKIFPVKQFGPAYLKDLHGPYPDLRLMPSGGVDAVNAAEYLEAGAFAVCCGTSVVPPGSVSAGRYLDITARAREFRQATERP